MGQCGITSSKTVLVFLNLIFWVSPREGRGRGRRARGCLSLSGEGRAWAGRGGRPGPEGAAGPGRLAAGRCSGMYGSGWRLPAPPRRFRRCLNVFCLTGALCPLAGPDS